MNSSSGINSFNCNHRPKTNQNIQVYVRVRPLNDRERCIRSAEVIDVISPKEIMTRHSADSKLTKKFTFDRTFGPDSKQADIYYTVVAPLIEEVLSGYNCTVFAYGQTGTGKTHTMVGTECAELKSSWEDDSEIGIIPRALSHLFDELRLMELEFSMRISYLELYNEELCDLLSSDDSTKIRIFDDTTKKGSVIIQGLEEIPVHSKDDVYKLLEKGKERRKTATTLMNAQSSRSHTVFSILVHIRENGIDGEEMLKIGKLNLVDLAGSENVSKAGNEKGIRVRETVNINQSLLTLGRVITALVERTPHIPYRESKLTRLLQESLGGRTKTSIIATISPGHKDIEETLSTLEYAHRAKNIQNKPEVNQKLTKKTVLKEYTEEIDKLKRDLMAARDKNGIYLAEETYNEMTLKMDSQNRELNEKMLLLKALKDELQSKEKIFNEVSLNLVKRTEELRRVEDNLSHTKDELIQTKKVLSTAKRRYKENKVLLQSHAKTEQDLTLQATKIMEVADLAANDTYKLQKTIDRRKDVDMKIQSVCEQFTGRMRNNFEFLNENLFKLREQHKLHSNLILDEIASSTKTQNKLLNDAENKIQNLKKICNNGLDSTQVLSNKFFKDFENLTEEHKTELLKFFQDLKRKEMELKNDIQTHLTVLQTCNEKQTNTIESLTEIIVNILEFHSKSLEENTLEMQKQLKRAEYITNTNMKELSKTEKELERQCNLSEEESVIINDFMEKFKSIKEKRINCSEAMQSILKDVKQNECNLISEFQQGSEYIQTFCNKQHSANETALKSVNKVSSIANSIVDDSITKCSILEVEIDNLCRESAMHIDRLNSIENTNCMQAQQLLSEYSTNLKRIRLENNEEISQGCTSLQNRLTEDSKLLKKHVTQTLAYATSLDNHVHDYVTVHEEQMQNCQNNLNKFKEKELRTYTSTGTTPSKRKFNYSRSLAVTSPHKNIIQRLRLENNLSDLDATRIDEEDFEEDSQNISITESVLNSTPINGSELSEYRKSCLQRNYTILKPSQPLQQHSSPHKFSTLECLDSLKNNKENEK